jgi:hypothetical protein
MQTSAFEVCGSSFDSLSRTGGQASILEIRGCGEGKAAERKNVGPCYTVLLYEPTFSNRAAFS